MNSAYSRDKNGMDQKDKQLLRHYLGKADIRVSGNRPWDIRIHDERVYSQILAEGSIAAGESYMSGWWDANELDRFFEKVFEANLQDTIYKPTQIIWLSLKNKLFNTQTTSRSYRVGMQHYDRGLDLFSRMLDKRLIYSCAYWNDAGDLEEAQEKKLDLICRKLELEPGMRLLDIGCGWGGLLKYAAENYGVEGTGITVSQTQAVYANESCKRLPVTIQLKDYRNLEGTYDRIASIGMVEHVGAKNYATFIQKASDCLAEDGLFLLHTIGNRRSILHTDPWIERYIFPNSMVPSIAQLSRALEPFFRLEDLHSFGPDYDRTIMAWDQNFRDRWDEISDAYGKVFYRMWRYYLMSSAASFRTRQLQLWQLLLAKHARRELVRTVR
ncbi:MAG: cyclopropane fatty acyl phospholipid synthase [Balneolaceae bacterium]